MSTEIDDLIAEARAGGKKYRGYAEEPLLRKLADALESTQAELRGYRAGARQDRELIDSQAHNLHAVQADLARAEAWDDGYDAALRNERRGLPFSTITPNPYIEQGGR